MPRQDVVVQVAQRLSLVEGFPQVGLVVVVAVVFVVGILAGYLGAGFVLVDLRQV